MAHREETYQHFILMAHHEETLAFCPHAHHEEKLAFDPHGSL